MDKQGDTDHLQEIPERLAMLDFLEIFCRERGNRALAIVCFSQGLFFKGSEMPLKIVFLRPQNWSPD